MIAGWSRQVHFPQTEMRCLIPAEDCRETPTTKRRKDVEKRPRTRKVLDELSQQIVQMLDSFCHGRSAIERERIDPGCVDDAKALAQSEADKEIASPR
jgi:hypothetical protein